MNTSLSSSGYAVVTDALRPDDVEMLRRRLVPQMLAHDANGEVVWPGRTDPALWRLPAFVALRDVAARLLGVRRPRLVFEHAIHREGHDPQFTGWHQDAAYFKRWISQRQVHLWVPLHDVDQSRGPLQYLPTRRSRKVLGHRGIAGTDRLELAGVDESVAVSCPVSVGSVVAHLPSTPHAALPNVSDEARQVYIAQFRVDGLAALRRASARG